MMISPNNLPRAQRGVSVVGVILLIFAIIIVAKLLIAIVPAHIVDYEITKILESELKAANLQHKSHQEFIEQVNQQLAINGQQELEASELFTFTNQHAGKLAIHKNYAKYNNFFGNIDIVNRFEGDIVTTDVTD